MVEFVDLKFCDESSQDSGNNKWNVLFVWPAMGKVGGVQVFVRNTTEEIVRLGGHCIVAAKDNAFLNQHTFIGKTLPIRNYRVHNFEVEETSSKSQLPLTIVSFNATSLSISIRLLKTLISKGQKASIFVYVLHPRSFCNSPIWTVNGILTRLILLSMGSQAVQFMNAECRDSHSKRISSRFMKSGITYLPVIGVDSVKDYRVEDTGNVKICSVGRITSFKAYNFYAASIVQELEQRGASVSWDIYGYGEDEEQLLKSIKGQSNVNFKGSLPMDRFKDLVGKYDLFVGMGTSAIMAAQLGVPVLLAIDSEGELCHGFAFEAPPGNVGEASNSMTRPPRLVDYISQYCKMGTAERVRVSTECFEWSRKFGYDEYFRKFSRLATNGVSTPSFLSFLLCEIYLRLLSFKKLIRKMQRRDF